MGRIFPAKETAEAKAQERRARKGLALTISYQGNKVTIRPDLAGTRMPGGGIWTERVGAEVG